MYIRLGPFLCADSKFTQQELPACKPLLTPAIVISLPAHHYFFCFQMNVCYIILSVRLMSTFREHRSFLPSYWLASYLSQLVSHRFLHHKRYIIICLYYVFLKKCSYYTFHLFFFYLLHLFSLSLDCNVDCGAGT